MNEAVVRAFLDHMSGGKLRYLTALDGSLCGLAVNRDSLNINQEKLFIHHHMFLLLRFCSDPPTVHPGFGFVMLILNT